MHVVDHGDRPLHFACRFSGNVDLVKYLISEVGCDPNSKGQNGDTPLHYACEQNQNNDGDRPIWR
jgi:ankyrin